MTIITQKKQNQRRRRLWALLLGTGTGLLGFYNSAYAQSSHDATFPAPSIPSVSINPSQEPVNDCEVILDSRSNAPGFRLKVRVPDNVAEIEVSPSSTADRQFRIRMDRHGQTNNPPAARFTAQQVRRPTDLHLPEIGPFQNDAAPADAASLRSGPRLVQNPFFEPRVAKVFPTAVSQLTGSRRVKPKSVSLEEIHNIKAADIDLGVRKSAIVVDENITNIVELPSLDGEPSSSQSAAIDGVPRILADHESIQVDPDQLEQIAGAWKSDSSPAGLTELRVQAIRYDNTLEGKLISPADSEIDLAIDRSTEVDSVGVQIAPVSLELDSDFNLTPFVTNSVLERPSISKVANDAFRLPISVSLTGPDSMKIGSTADFTITMRNDSSIDIQGVSLQLAPTVGARVVVIDREGEFDQQDHSITWFQPLILAGQESVFRYRLQADEAGDLEHRATLRQPVAGQQTASIQATQMTVIR